LLRFEPLMLACLGVACHLAPTANAPPTVARPNPLAAPAPRVPPAPPAPASLPSLAALVESLREPAWEPGTDAKLHDIGHFHAFVVDFETIEKRTDGMPVGFRRFALFDAAFHLLGHYTVDKSQGGADLVEVEPRDVDGDGRDDLVFYYSATDGWNPSHYGLVVATAGGAFFGYPLDIALPNDARLQGSGCWALAESTPIFVVRWQHIRPDRAGNPSVLAVRDGAIAIEARGPRAVSVFGWLLAESKDEVDLQAILPERHRQVDPESAVRAPDCSAGRRFVVIGHRGFHALIGGLALTAEGAGQTWPSDVPRPKKRQPFEIPSLDTKTWPMNPAPKSK
jgi:hypothetical protein